MTSSDLKASTREEGGGGGVGWQVRLVHTLLNNVVSFLIFFRLLLPNCFNWKIYCDDHSSLSLSALWASNSG